MIRRLRFGTLHVSAVPRLMDGEPPARQRQGLQHAATDEVEIKQDDDVEQLILHLASPREIRKILIRKMGNIQV